MNLFAKFESMKNISNNEKRIIELIQMDPVAFTKMDVQDIIEKCYVSKATVYRLCQKLNYSGLNELKLMVTASFSDALMHQEKEIDFNKPFSIEDTEFTVLSNLRQLYDQSIFLASTYMNVKELKLIALDLVKASSIIVFIDDEQYHVAKIFKDRMERIGAKVSVPSNDFMKVSLAQSSRAYDVILYASYNPVHKKHLELIKIVKGNRSKVVLISSAKDHILSQQGHRNLMLGPSEQNFSKIADFSLNIVFQYVFDCIYSVYFKEDYETNTERLKASYLKFNNL